VSLSLHSSVRVGLSPGRVAALRFARTLRAKVAAKHAVACTNDGSVGETLRAVGAQRTAVTAILSNRYVRYAALPWNDKIKGPREELAFARHCLGQIYGDQVDEMEIRVNPSRPGHAWVACGIDGELLSMLRQAAAAAGANLISVQPHLMAAHNRWRERMNGMGDRFFLLGEGGAYACALIRRGHCHAIHSGILNGGLANELPRILDRECIWSGVAERPPVLVHAPGMEPLPESGWRMDLLRLPAIPGFSPNADHEFAMALT
jgi:hypothetical protein